MFKVIIGGMKAGECLTFQEAYKEFFARTNSAYARGVPARRLIASSFIEYHNPFLWFGSPHRMDSHQARDFAHQLGLLNADDELQKSCRFISLLELDEVFSLTTEENIKLLKNLREETLHVPNDPT